MNLHEKALAVKAIVLDIDGVLTPGQIGYGAGSGEEIKFFHVRDGHGIKMAMRAGLKVGILSGRSSGANRRRAEELSLSFCYEGAKDKGAALTQLLSENGLSAEECLYVGDDLVDIPAMRKVGVAVAVADGVSELDQCCHWRTKLPGGHGAVREVIEWLLKEQGKWEALIARYIS
ncbi:MAG: hypothetical protein A2X49_01170 [Lentisphaerae bacterium GWF2_52_8]|nr:MAG: hypothetical protein A2X49_01170 [Lentisphaerae bacterium GWF2_52_8]